MGKYAKAAIIGIIVAFVIAFGLSTLTAGAGAEPSRIPMLVGLVFGMIAFYVMANLAGTRPTVSASAEDRRAALSAAPPSDRGRLVILREGFVGMAVGLDVTLDGREIAQLKGGQFISLDLPPGPHTVGLAFGGLAASQNRPVEEAVTVAEGRVSVLRLTLKLGAVKNTIAVERLDGADLGDRLSRMKMVAAG